MYLHLRPFQEQKLILTLSEHHCSQQWRSALSHRHCGGGRKDTKGAVGEGCTSAFQHSLLKKQNRKPDPALMESNAVCRPGESPGEYGSSELSATLAIFPLVFWGVSVTHTVTSWFGLDKGRRTRLSTTGPLPVTLEGLTMISVGYTLRTDLPPRLSMSEKQLQFHVILKFNVETTGSLNL